MECDKKTERGTRKGRLELVLIPTPRVSGQPVTMIQQGCIINSDWEDQEHHTPPVERSDRVRDVTLTFR
jgi:hypothetical protein